MQEQTEDLLKTAKRDLQTAISLSGQGSYHRRAPTSVSLPHYGEAKRRLLLILEVKPDHREALMMMAQIAEGLMDFKAAHETIGKAIKAGEPKTKKLLKKQKQLQENFKAWEKLALTPDMLRELGDYLESNGISPENHSLDFTRNWLLLNFDGDSEVVIKSLGERGAYSDFQVLANVVQG